MKRFALAFVILTSCSDAEPGWSDNPAIEVCEEIFIECDDEQLSYEEFDACGREVIESSGVERRTNTRDCSVPGWDGDLILTAVSTTRGEDDFGGCTAYLHDRMCWRYP